MQDPPVSESLLGDSKYSQRKLWELHDSIACFKPEESNLRKTPILGIHN